MTMKPFALTLALLGALFLTMTRPGMAQTADQRWLQIEAQPTLREAEARARAYAGAFPNVAGFQLSSGWYAIALGPFSPAEAETRLRDLKRDRMIPADSYVAEGNTYRQAFWPVGSAQVPAQGAEVAPVEVAPLAPATTDPILDTAIAAAPPDTAPETAPEPVPTAPPEETPAEESPAEAKRSEAALDRAGREALQTALQWFGFYDGKIDGAFGPGTRKSMAAWQEANGFEPTGILTTSQRAALLGAQQQQQVELGLQTVTEAEAGIEITLPLALVGFDHYEPPFVHFPQKGGSGVNVILISQPGDQGTLYALYDTLQTLAILPLEGDRSRAERSFTITGRNGAVESHAYAELSKGLVKGYILSYPPSEAEKMGRVLAAMRSSFTPLGDRALDPGLVPMTAETRAGLLAGLEVRRPLRSRSGLFVDGAGSVLTSVEAIAGCGRITLDRDHQASVAVSDAASGLAVLKPERALSPQAVAEFATGAGRAGAEVAVSGYSYEDLLPSPTLTFGTLADIRGLNGEDGISRLSIATLPGDSGGPVFDTAGAVIGVLLPRDDQAARQLPPEVGFAAGPEPILNALTQAGITPRARAGEGALAPEDLTRLATGLTVLVSCWE